MHRMTPQEEPSLVGLFITRVRLAPVRSSSSTTDGVEAITFGVLFEIMMIPEESRARDYAKLQTSVLEHVNIRESVRIQLPDNDSHMLYQFLQQGQHGNPEPALEGIFRYTYTYCAIGCVGSMVDEVDLTFPCINTPRFGYMILYPKLFLIGLSQNRVVVSHREFHGITEMLHRGIRCPRDVSRPID